MYNWYYVFILTFLKECLISRHKKIYVIVFIWHSLLLLKYYQSNSKKCLLLLTKVKDKVNIVFSMFEVLS